MENAPMHRPMRQASRQVRNIDQLHASGHSTKKACLLSP